MDEIGAIEDVPSPVDFRDPRQAETWVRRTVERRPFRPAVFAAFVTALNEAFDDPIDVVELGSGPGHLAREILQRCDVRRYAAVDFSAAMHDLARGELGSDASRVQCLELDFRDPAWTQHVGAADAVVTMQAAHEVRHRARLPRLLQQTRAVLRPGGVCLYCDHYAGAGKAPELYLSRAEQPAALTAAGYRQVRRLLDEGGLALYAARA